MKKIPTLFMRKEDDPGRVIDVVRPGCEWVINGEGVPTEKFDGTACLVQEGRLYKRKTVRKGQTPPDDFIPVEGRSPDSGKLIGWVPVDEADSSDQHHIEAWGYASAALIAGTYELVGPKVQRNPYQLDEHELRLHGCQILHDAVPVQFEPLREYLERTPIEGIVWWDFSDLTRKAKIKRTDFGLPWPLL